MVYIRRKFKRKARTVRRKMRRTMPRQVATLNQGKLYKFKRTCQLLPFYLDGSVWSQYANNIISNGTTAPSITGILKFRLEDLPNATDFTQMFEQFKITGVKIRFIPYIGTESSGSTATSAFTETMAIAIDRGANDQVLASPSFNNLLENQDVKLRNSQRPFSLWVGSPTFHQPADGLTQGSYKSGWLDSELVGSRNVDYHGVKWAFQTTRTDAQSISYRVFATYYVTCRNPQ